MSSWIKLGVQGLDRVNTSAIRMYRGEVGCLFVKWKRGKDATYADPDGALLAALDAACFPHMQHEWQTTTDDAGVAQCIHCESVVATSGPDATWSPDWSLKAPWYRSDLDEVHMRRTGQVNEPRAEPTTVECSVCGHDIVVR